MPGRRWSHGGGDRGRRPIYVRRWCRRTGAVVQSYTLSVHLVLPISNAPLPVQLGHGDRQMRRAPRKVAALNGERVLMAACGAYHTAACTDSGKVWTWGQGRWGLLGHGDRDVDRPVPTKVGNNDGHSFREERVVMVACGARHTAAVTAQGGLWTWVGSPHKHTLAPPPAPRQVPGFKSDYPPLSPCREWASSGSWEWTRRPARDSQACRARLLSGPA